MITHDPRWSLPHGSTPVPSRWQATGDALVDPGAPVGATRTVSTTGTHDGPAAGPVNGWSVLEAANAEEAAQKLSDHPFIGRGGVLQISEPAGG